MSQGYDNPIQKRDEDYLGRWGFANEIFQIAMNSPDEWPVRIGIYGKWGSGKTSILYLIEQIANSENHIIIRFNPWKYNNTNIMWKEFVLILHRSLKNYDSNLKRFSFKKEFKALLSNSTEFIKSLSKVHEVSGAITDAGYSVISRFVEFGQKDLQKLSKTINNKKIFIFIDDLDRTHPKLIPELLYSVKELLDLPGFIFIMSFDPESVGQALKEFHSGWGDGIKFLEKIIDFPKWVPVPSKENLWLLINADIDKYCSFINREALANIFEFLPENPRTLRMFLRQIWSLKPYISRFDESEIQWEVLFLFVILKLLKHELIKELLDNKPLVEKITSIRLDEREIGEVEKILSHIYSKLQIDEPLKIELTNLILEIGKHIPLSMSNETLIFHAYLGEQSPIITGKEFDLFLASIGDDFTYTNVESWIVEFSKKHDYSWNLVFKSLFKKLIDFRENILNMAADAIAIENLNAHLEQAEKNLSLISIMSYELEGFIGKTNLDVEDFDLVLKMILKWVQFDDSDNYIKIRNDEKLFIQILVREATLSPVKMLNKIKPWELYPPEIEGMELRKQMIDELSNILEPKTVNHLLQKFEEENGIQRFRFMSNPIYEYVFFRKESCFWKEPNLGNFLNILNRARENRIIQDNLVELILISEYLTKRQTSIFISETEIFDKIWSSALSRPFNPRYIYSLNRIRIDFEQKFERTLKVPNWWTAFFADQQKSELKPELIHDEGREN